MEDLEKTQNRKSCDLSMPDGLENLMFDISREVLRAQPEETDRFIADYLRAMLLARDSLNVASYVCEYMNNAPGPVPLDGQLKDANLTEEEAAEAQKIVNQYLQDDEVANANLSGRLMAANIDKGKIWSVKRAVETAFRRQIIGRLPPLHMEVECSPEAKLAAASTLRGHRRPGAPAAERPSPAGQLEVPYGEDDRRVHIKGGKPSSDSSDDIFENIQYDGDIQDFYVSGNDRPYKNSSLTSLAGSYGVAKCKDLASYQGLQEEHRVVSYDEQEQGREAAGGLVRSGLAGAQHGLEDEVLISVDDAFRPDPNDGQMPDARTDYEDEIIEDSVSDAGNDSDESFDEDIY